MSDRFSAFFVALAAILYPLHWVLVILIGLTLPLWIGFAVAYWTIKRAVIWCIT